MPTESAPSESVSAVATLEDFVSKGWNDHATDAEGVFRRFPDGIALVSDKKHLAPLAALVVHVAGEHLGRWDDGIALLAQLERHRTFDAATLEGKAVLRAQATLHLVAGRHAEADRLEARSRTGAAVPDASNRIRVLAVAATALTGQGRTADAGTMLEDALTLASYGPTKEDPAARSLAITGNNLASALEEKKTRSADETALMVRAAEVGLRFWSVAGTWLETERAHYRLSNSLRLAGDSQRAIEHARRCLAVVEANGTDPGEAFYAREALALAHHADGDAAAAAIEREAAAAHLSGITDDEFRAMAKDSLAALDKALGTRSA